jgi:hypothetical protein
VSDCKHGEEADICVVCENERITQLEAENARYQRIVDTAAAETEQVAVEFQSLRDENAALTERVRVLEAFAKWVQGLDTKAYPSILPLKISAQAVLGEGEPRLDTEEKRRAFADRQDKATRDKLEANRIARERSALGKGEL